MNIRACTNCERQTALEDSSFCKNCLIVDNKRIRTLEMKYGLPEGGYKQLLEKQDGRCAICERSGLRLHIDHDHDTREVRGLLCSSCNTGIGHLADDLKRLHAAIEYLSKSHTGYFQPIRYKNITSRMDVPENHGHCKKCDRIKPADEMVKSGDRIYRICKSCRSDQYFASTCR